MPDKKHKGISSQLFVELLARSEAKKQKAELRGDLVDDAVALCEFLMEIGVFDGTQYDLATALGMSFGRVSRAISLTRTEFWIKTFNCTIPWQAKGPGEKTYSLVDSKSSLHLVEDGNNLRTGHIRMQIERLLWSIELEWELETEPNIKASLEWNVFRMRQTLEGYKMTEQMRLARKVA